VVEVTRCLPANVVGGLGLKPEAGSCLRWPFPGWPSPPGTTILTTMVCKKPREEGSQSFLRRQSRSPDGRSGKSGC
jgi:hypothetical protein